MSSCQNEPCLNGGTCADDAFRKQYHCTCPKGWTSKHCEEKTLTCAEKPCVQGTCRDTANGLVCTCPIGYSGKYCDVQVDECKPNPCKNGGECSTVGNDYKCTCQPGFIGDDCETNVDDCAGNPCLNGGTCVDMVKQYRCQCIAGYIGANCASKVDLCLTKPCANGGSCINLNNDYRCVCRSGFTGKDCSIDIDECSSTPCKNGGTCVNRVNSYQCVCPGGFRGPQCEDEAASNPDCNSTHIQTTTTQAYNTGLSKSQVVVIAILSVAMPIVLSVAACVLHCMKRKRKRDQQKEDAEARKQNERNASATLHHANSINSSKRSSSTGLTFDNSNPTIIKNTWDKSVNNISSSASVDECLMNTSCYGAMANYNDTDCFTAAAVASQIPPLQRAKSQKQLNTDPSVMHRASQIIPKDYSMSDHKRMSCIGNSSNSGSGGGVPGNGTISGGCAAAAAMASMPTDALLCGAVQRWQPQPITSSGSPHKSSYGPCSPSHM